MKVLLNRCCIACLPHTLTFEKIVVLVFSAHLILSAILRTNFWHSNLF